jgi:hypothetical protein
MASNIKDIINNIKTISMSDSALETLMDFERVLDELDIYVFKNWKGGELVEGPIYEKYFVTCTFMWPYNKPPDTKGAFRLLDYDCEVKYREEELEYPIKIKDPSDFKPGTKVARTGKVPVWLVEIVMPKKLMFEIERGSLELENESIDAEDVEQAYETGQDQTVDQTQQAQPGPAPAPAAGPAPGAPAPAPVM